MKRHWIIRVYDHFTPAAGDALVIAAIVGGMALVAYLALTGQL